MKFLITYSSKTGNTKKIAQALYAAAPAGSVIMDIQDAPTSDGYDVIFVGYWIDRGHPDETAKQFLRKLKQKKVVLFETLGALPNSEHAYTGFANAGTCLDESNSVVGVLAIQGAVDPTLIASMKKLPAGNPHHSPQMDNLLKDAATHPDEADREKAKQYMTEFVNKWTRYNQSRQKRK